MKNTVQQSVVLPIGPPFSLKEALDPVRLGGRYAVQVCCAMPACLHCSALSI